MSNNVLLEKNGAIAIITLNRPQAMNTYNAELAEALSLATENVKNDAAIRAVLLRGNGPMFMAGGDLQFFQANMAAMESHVPFMMQFVKQTITNLTTMPKPVLASVHGSVAGIGISLLAAADLVIAAKSTKFNLAYGALGITPDGGASYFLPRLLGTKKAMAMALLPEIFDAKNAQEMGLINWVAEDEELANLTEKRLQQLARAPTMALAKAKLLINQSLENTLSAQLEAEQLAFAACAKSADFKEGVQAFLEKRRAVFNNH